MGGGRISMKIVFFGTPDYVLPILQAVHKAFVTGPGKTPIVAVVTQKPKPVGRKEIMTYSPIDKWAHEHGVETRYDFEKMLPEADLGICAAYGEIIPKNVINHFKFGILNVHPSLLPKYRGASPIQEALVNGDSVTGVSIIKMDEHMDHGPIVTKFKEEILPTDTFMSLRTRLFEKASNVLVELIEPYTKGKITPKAQDHTQATFTKLIVKQDGFVNLDKDDPALIERKLRAYTPWPGIWTLVNEKRLKILKAHMEADKLEIDEVQLEGKKPVSWAVFKRARDL